MSKTQSRECTATRQETLLEAAKIDLPSWILKVAFSAFSKTCDFSKTRSREQTDTRQETLLKAAEINLPSWILKCAIV